MEVKSPSIRVIRRLFSEYILQFKGTIITAFFLMIIVALTTSSYAYLVRDVLDKIFVEKNTSFLLVLPIFVIFITLIKNVALYFQVVLMQVLSQKIFVQLQSRLFSALVSWDLRKFNEKHTGSMISMILHDAQVITNGINMIFTTLIRELLTVIFLIGVLFWQNYELALVSFIALPLVFYPVIRIAKKVRKLYDKSQIGLHQFVAVMDDSLKSMRVIKAYGAEEYEERRINSILKSLLGIRKKTVRVANLSSPLVECISVIGIAFVIWYGGAQVISGKTTPGVFFSFFVAMTIAYKPFKSLSNVNIAMQSLVVATENFFKVIDEKPLITNSPNAVEFKGIKKGIKFRNVGFYYDEGKQILQNINLEIKRHAKVALVGPTGAGKSTIISLLMRLYDPSSGEILLDGKNLKEFELASLRRGLSYVGQDTQLFDDTIENNIKYSKMEATDSEVEEAARLANAHEFIEKMPQGYKTRIGQAGVNLSGGQKQRLSIARAILKGADIIILDEPTSALDAISEKLIKEAIDSLAHKKTIITIAHRLSTIKDADIIYVIESGTVTEHGTHAELLEQDGHYARLYTSQFSIS